MAKMWAGRTAGVTDPVADDFNSSIHFDSRMYREDITGSMAHAAMLGAQHILPSADADAIIDALQGILDDLDSGALAIDPACEDIHMFVEQVLTARIGDLGKKLHTARSRNDQVALDLRMYLRSETQEIVALTKDVLAALDAGDVIRTVSTEIGEREDAAALTLRLSELGAQALSETIPTLADGTAKRTPQDESAFTYAPMLDRSLSPIDWTRSAWEIDCQVRGLIPWPCAATSVDGKSVKVYETLSGEMTADAPGTMHAVKRGLSVACGDGRSLIITQLQAEGGKRMAAADYLRGHPLKTNG